MPQNFQKDLKYVLSREGGYSNNKHDLGGETNKGITHSTYNAYRQSRGLPIQSVKNISDKEVSDIYYNNYYKASGADQIKDPKLATAVFDTAVNMGVSRAKDFLQKSGGDVNKYLELRKEKYEEFAKVNPSQRVFLQGWLNRVNDLQNHIKNTESTTIPTQQTKQTNPMVLKGSVIENVYKNPELGNSGKIFTREEIGQMSQDEFIKNEKAIDYQMKTIGVPSRQQLPNGKLNSSSGQKSGSGSSSDGHWVTINGNHVFIED